MIFLLLLCAYGICFGFQHKLKLIHNRNKFIDDMLSCTYCTGFHSGWIAYTVYTFLSQANFEISNIFIYAFASSVFCYALDVMVQYFEK